MNIKNAITMKIGRTILKTKKNSPALMFGVGIVAMVGTVVLSSKATLELEDTVIAAEDSALANSRQEKINVSLSVVKLYAPAIVMGVVSVGCLTGSHVTLTRRNAALTAAYAALHKSYIEYRERVNAEYGDEKERQLAFGIEEKDIIRDKSGKSVGTIGAPGHSVYARFFDESSQVWSREPEYNLVWVKTQQNYLNDLLHARGHVFLNEAYDSLGIPRTKAGQVVGWLISKENGDNYIDFGVYDHNNERTRAFVNGHEGSILLDFNVDGPIYHLIEEGR